MLRNRPPYAEKTHCRNRCVQMVVHVKLEATYTFLSVDYQAFVMQKCKMQAKRQKIIYQS